MNSLTCYYEKNIGNYNVSANKYYHGYLGEQEISVDVLSLETLEEIESKPVDMLEMFSVFCAMCRKYEEIAGRESV